MPVMTDINDTGVRPVGDHVLIRRDPKVDKSSGGIHLMDSPASWPWTGLVLAVGDKVDDPDVVPGRRVLFEPKAGSALIPDNREGGRPEWERVVKLPLEHVLGLVEDE